MSIKDLDQIIEIEKTIYSFPWTRGNFSDALQARYSCWIYRDGAALIGYAVVMVAVEEAHLLNLSIASAYQKQGYGTRFMMYLIQLAQEQNAKRFFLEARPSNKAALRLYERFGFEQVSRRRDYYPAHGSHNSREDALIMCLEL